MWDELSMAEKALLIKLCVENGVTDLDSMKNMYNLYAKGGYAKWKKQIKRHKGIDIDKDDTYDYKGFYNEDRVRAWDMLSDDPEAHFVDTYKTAKHPTFSEESRYSGTVNKFNPEGITGGRWEGDDRYIMSLDLLDRDWDTDRTLDYLQWADPNVRMYSPDGESLMLRSVTIPASEYALGGSFNKFDGGGDTNGVQYPEDLSYQAILDAQDYNERMDKLTKRGLLYNTNELTKPWYRERVERELTDQDPDRFINALSSNVNKAYYSSPENIARNANSQLFGEDPNAAGGYDPSTGEITYAPEFIDAMKQEVPDINMLHTIENIAQHEGKHAQRGINGKHGSWVQRVIDNHNYPLKPKLTDKALEFFGSPEVADKIIARNPDITADMVKDYLSQYYSDDDELRVRALKLLEQQYNTGKSFEELIDPEYLNSNGMKDLLYYDRDQLLNYLNHFVYNPIEQPLTYNIGNMAAYGGRVNKFSGGGNQGNPPDPYSIDPNDHEGYQAYLDYDYSTAYPAGIPEGFSMDNFFFTYPEDKPVLYTNDGAPRRITSNDIVYDHKTGRKGGKNTGMGQPIRRATANELETYNNVIKWRQELTEKQRQARNFKAGANLGGFDLHDYGTSLDNPIELDEHTVMGIAGKPLEEAPAAIAPAGYGAPDLAGLADQHKIDVLNADNRVRETAAFEKPLNFLSPGQWFGAGVDYLQGETDDFFGSIYHGNSGWVTDNFARENPRLSALLNFAGDIVIPYGVSEIPTVKNWTIAGGKKLYNNYRGYRISRAFNDAINNNPYFDVMNDNPALKDIGNAIEYRNYLDNVFPESKVKDIQWHGGDATLGTVEASRVDPELGSMEGFYTTPQKSYAGTYGEPKPVLLNMENPLNTTGRWTGVLDPSDVLSVRLKGHDGIVNSRFNTNPLLPANPENVTFNPEQVHFLGSEADIRGFKEFNPNPKNIEGLQDPYFMNRPDFKLLGDKIYKPGEQVSWTDYLGLDNAIKLRRFYDKDVRPRLVEALNRENNIMTPEEEVLSKSNIFSHPLIVGEENLDARVLGIAEGDRVIIPYDKMSGPDIDLETVVHEGEHVLRYKLDREGENVSRHRERRGPSLLKSNNPLTENKYRTIYSDKEVNYLENAYEFSDDFLNDHPDMSPISEKGATNREFRFLISEDSGGLLGKELDKYIDSMDDALLIDYLKKVSGYSEDFYKEFVRKNELTPGSEDIPKHILKEKAALIREALKHVAMNDVDNSNLGNDIYYA